MVSRTLQASINDQPVGTLSDDNGRWCFEYATNWMAQADSFALSPQLPLQHKAHEDNSSQRQVQWYFDNLLPEEGQRTLLALDAQIEQADTFSLLGYYGAESAGSLTLQSTDVIAGNLEHETVALQDDELEQRIIRLPSVPLSHGASKRMSLAGAQHKLAVVLTKGHLFEPKGHAASTHILKPDHPSVNFAHSVVNEWFVMQLARKLTLNVPDVFRRYIPSAVYIIERFDRRHYDGRVERLHSIDACQLLGMDSAFKYQQGSLSKLVDIAKACRSTALTRTRLFSWLVFNVLVGNTDAHLKNLSFMVDHNGIELAPFYDLLSTGVYETPAFDGNTWPEKSMMAWPLPGAQYVGEIDRNVMINAGQELGLNITTSARLLDYQLDRILATAKTLNANMQSLNKRSNAPDVAMGIQLEAENRCVRSIIFSVIEPMVQQLRASS